MPFKKQQQIQRLQWPALCAAFASLAAAQTATPSLRTTGPVPTEAASTEDPDNFNSDAYYYNEYGVSEYTHRYWYFYLVPIVVIVLAGTAIGVWYQSLRSNNSTTLNEAGHHVLSRVSSNRSLSQVQPIMDDDDEESPEKGKGRRVKRRLSNGTFFQTRARSVASSKSLMKQKGNAEQKETPRHSHVTSPTGKTLGQQGSSRILIPDEAATPVVLDGTDDGTRIVEM
eukprot:INCI14225.1.p2 GENE.INCI14225.1~~INCI14225.1.p2  ORF type:complete len:227 (-),score=36.50 INCI14225.1:1343-2023(-)